MSGPGDPSIRTAGTGDAAAIRDLTRLAYAKWVPLLGREPLPMTADHERAVREDRVDLALEDDHIVALVHMVARADDLLVENLAVEPGRQHAGWGAILLARAEGIATAAGKPAIRLYTNLLMTGNVAFYAARGYEIEREEPIGAGTRVHMVKALAAGKPRP